MKHIVYIFLFLGCGASLCSPTVSATETESASKEKSGRAVFRFGLAGGESKVISDGKMNSASVATGVGEFRFGYEFPTSLVLDLGVQGYAMGARGHQSVLDDSRSSANTSRALAASTAGGSLYSATVGYKFGRFRPYGGFGVGSLTEDRLLSGDPETQYAVHNQIAGPIFGLGFVMLKSKSAELELGADVSYLNSIPQAKMDEKQSTEEAERKDNRILTHSLGLKLNLFTDGDRGRSHGSTSSGESHYSTSIYCTSDCIRGMGQLFSIVPQIGFEVTKALLQAALRVH